MPVVMLPTDQIRDWETFHSVCQKTLGFPEFYGRNMDAWIDCLTYLDDGDGMSTFTLKPDERLLLEIPDALAFRERVPEVFTALLECTAFVNKRYVDRGKRPPVGLVFA